MCYLLLQNSHDIHGRYVAEIQMYESEQLEHGYDLQANVVHSPTILEYAFLFFLKNYTKISIVVWFLTLFLPSPKTLLFSFFRGFAIGHVRSPDTERETER